MGNTRAHMKSLSLVTLCLVLSLAHAGYVEITSSTCAEQDKYLVCDDSDCYAAAAALGLGNGRKVSSSSLPSGCIANPDHNGNGPTYGFNRNGMSTEPCSTRDYNGNYNGSTSWSCLCRETACPVPSSQASSEPSSSPTNVPQQTTCLDLKTVYQNHTCCGKNTTKAAAFTNTPTTCGSVLDSYKTSACCSESLNKSAVMTF